MKDAHPLIALAILVVALPACAEAQDGAQEEARAASETPSEEAVRTEAVAGQLGDSATYDIVDGDGETVGRVEALDGSGGVLLKVRVEGLEPGLHGLHVHQTGRCEPPAFESAGGHYAPRGRNHGFLSEGGPHAGDLPNLGVEDGGGATTVHVFLDGLTLPELQEDDGSALMFHAGEDDYRTDPSGGSGAQVACAAITGD